MRDLTLTTIASAAFHLCTFSHFILPLHLPLSDLSPSPIVTESTYKKILETADFDPEAADEDEEEGNEEEEKGDSDSDEPAPLDPELSADVVEARSCSFLLNIVIVRNCESF